VFSKSCHDRCILLLKELSCFLKWKDRKYFFQDLSITRLMSRPITHEQNFRSLAYSVSLNSGIYQFYCANWHNKWYQRFSLINAFHSYRPKIAYKLIINLMLCIFIYHLFLGFKFKGTSWFKKEIQNLLF
jgi:hypothetical protein